MRKSMSPSEFAPPEPEFAEYKKLDDLPKNGKVHTAAEIMKAMAVLHRMVHAQAKAYGGKNSRLLAAGIAENCSFKTFLKVIDDKKD